MGEGPWQSLVNQPCLSLFEKFWKTTVGHQNAQLRNRTNI